MDYDQELWEEDVPMDSAPLMYLASAVDLVMRQMQDEVPPQQSLASSYEQLAVYPPMQSIPQIPVSQYTWQQHYQTSHFPSMPAGVQPLDGSFFEQAEQVNPSAQAHHNLNYTDTTAPPAIAPAATIADLDTGEATKPKKKYKRDPVPPCTYPGCVRKEGFSRPVSYRRHMFSQHGIVIPTEKKTKKNADHLDDSTNIPIDPMMAYLKGQGQRLPQDVLVKDRNPMAITTTDTNHPDMIDADTAKLREEITGLRKKLHEVASELRLERSRNEGIIAHQEWVQRAEEDEIFEFHQEELKAARPGDLVFAAQSDEIVNIRREMRKEQEEKITNLQVRHSQNERRLWALLV